MPKHPKRPRDPNQLGKLIVALATGEKTEEEPVPDSPVPSEPKSSASLWKG